MAIINRKLRGLVKNINYNKVGGYILEFSFNINVLEVAFSVIIAIITALITAKVALRHFYRQEIWLRKDKKYSEIIDKLCALMNYQDNQWGKFVLNKNNALEEELIEQEYKNAKKDLEKIRFSIGFIINPKVNKIISEMIEDFEIKDINERQGDIGSQIDRVYGVIKEAIEKIIEIANEDLEKK